MDFSSIGFYSTCEEVVGVSSTITKCYNPAVSYAVILSVIFLGLLVSYGFLKLMK